MARILQANINHSGRAQDLLVQTMMEGGYEFAIVSEPYRTSENNSKWITDIGNNVALLWGNKYKGKKKIISRERGFIIAEWNGIIIVGCYISPSLRLEDFNVFLNRMGSSLRSCSRSNKSIIVMGDFNAHSKLWGSRITNSRGRDLEIWAASMDLHLLNTGIEPTCIRWQGQSRIDLTWCSTIVSKLRLQWRVLKDKETLSDHNYIEIVIDRDIQNAGKMTHKGVSGNLGPRWKIKTLNMDMLKAGFIACSWQSNEKIQEEGGFNIEAEVDRLQQEVTTVCNMAMVKVNKTITTRKAMYWWSEEIKNLRAHCIGMKRAYTREKRRKRNREEDIEHKYENWKDAKKSLRQAITKAKERAWQELIDTIDDDPWGRPYQIVLKKLKTGGVADIGSMDPQFVTEIVNTLFPGDENANTTIARTRGKIELWSDDPPPVEEEEINTAMQRMKPGTKAPGPDGIRGKIWINSMDHMARRILQLYNECFRQGKFPSAWKKANLILLIKPGKDVNTPSGYRPICLIDDIGKILERIIANRIVRHMEEKGTNLSDAQYGFRRGRSTIDAIQRVRTTSQEWVQKGGKLLAVSIDVNNAFNSITWEAIMSAMDHYKIPQYLKTIIRDYFKERYITYMINDKETRHKQINRGVPQGSVLGPLFWDMAYDSVLRIKLPEQATITCYADDTLILVGDITWERTCNKTELTLACINREIKKLGLKIAPEKTEIIPFYKERTEPPGNMTVRLGGESITLKNELKYLGLILDGRWRWLKHFTKVSEKASRTANALGRLLPNIGGP